MAGPGHPLVELFMNVLLTPVVAVRILDHLEAGNRRAAGVAKEIWNGVEALFVEHLVRCGGGAIGQLDDELCFDLVDVALRDGAFDGGQYEDIHVESQELVVGHVVGSLAADRKGISFYYYDKICTILHLPLDDYIQARDALIENNLLAFDSHRFQVLSLPETPVSRHKKLLRTRDDMAQYDPATILETSATSSVPIPTINSGNSAGGFPLTQILISAPEPMEELQWLSHPSMDQAPMTRSDLQAAQLSWFAVSGQGGDIGRSRKSKSKENPSHTRENPKQGVVLHPPGGNLSQCPQKTPCFEPSLPNNRRFRIQRWVPKSMQTYAKPRIEQPRGGSDLAAVVGPFWIGVDIEKEPSSHQVVKWGNSGSEERGISS